VIVVVLLKSEGEGEGRDRPDRAEMVREGRGPKARLK
jgi:hypothetical protein